MSAGMKKMILVPFLCIMLSYMVSQKNIEKCFMLLLFQGFKYMDNIESLHFTLVTT